MASQNTELLMEEIDKLVNPTDLREILDSITIMLQPYTDDNDTLNLFGLMNVWVQQGVLDDLPEMKDYFMKAVYESLEEEMPKPHQLN